MELKYTNPFVRKYSFGNSFADEEDLENKKFKVHFINKWTIFLFSLFFVSGIIITTLMLVYRNSSTLYKYWYSKPVVREKPKVFHVDKHIDCTKQGKRCVGVKELKSEYSLLITQKLKEQKMDVVDIDSFFCNDPSRNKYCETVSGELLGITKKELNSMVELLTDENIDLDVDFEVATISKFKKFIKTFKKEYADVSEYKKKYSNFRKNRIYIESHNLDPKKMYTMGYTIASDSGWNEMDVAILDKSSVKYMVEDDEVITKGYGSVRDPNHYPGKIFDWREKKVILPVRDQGKCGSCWAFTTTELLSSMVAIKTKVLKEFSPQQLMDCAYPHFTCDRGGNPFLAFIYIDSFNICTEEEYPYKMGDYRCRQPNNCTNSFKISPVDLRYKDLIEYLEKNGPFLYMMNVNRDFAFYKEGIYTPNCSRNSNHGVVVVGHGFDDTHQVPYLIVKNSWSKDWGEQGYFRMLLDYDNIDGVKRFYCGIDKRSYGLEVL